MAKLKVLSEAEIAILKEMVDAHKKRSTRSERSSDAITEHSAPPTYLALPPCGKSIPAMAADGTPGRQRCCLFKLEWANDSLDSEHEIVPIELSPGEAYREEIYNVYGVESPDGVYIPVTRTASGAWLCFKPDVGDETTTTQTVIPSTCFGTCTWTWSTASNRWNKTADGCEYGTPTTTTTAGATTTTTTGEGGTTTTTGGATTTTACPCSDEDSAGGIDSPTTTTAEPTCNCLYPSFCGTINGETTQTGCSQYPNTPPSGCGPTTEAPCDCGTSTSTTTGAPGEPRYCQGCYKFTINGGVDAVYTDIISDCAECGGCSGLRSKFNTDCWDGRWRVSCPCSVNRFECLSAGGDDWTPPRPCEGTCTWKWIAEREIPDPDDPQHSLTVFGGWVRASSTCTGGDQCVCEAPAVDPEAGYEACDEEETPCVEIGDYPWDCYWHCAPTTTSPPTTTATPTTSGPTTTTTLAPCCSRLPASAVLHITGTGSCGEINDDIYFNKLPGSDCLRASGFYACGDAYQIDLCCTGEGTMAATGVCGCCTPPTLSCTGAWDCNNDPITFTVNCTSTDTSGCACCDGSGTTSGATTTLGVPTTTTTTTTIAPCTGSCTWNWCPAQSRWMLVSQTCSDGGSPTPPCLCFPPAGSGTESCEASVNSCARSGVGVGTISTESCSDGICKVCTGVCTYTWDSSGAGFWTLTGDDCNCTCYPPGAPGTIHGQTQPGSCAIP